MPPAIALAESTISEKYAISLTLPDRWTHREDTKSKGFFRVYAADARDQANLMLTADAKEGKKDPTIEEWMERLVIPRVLKWYTEGYEYQATLKKSQVTLGNGSVASVVEYDIYINTNRRSIVLLYWERDGIWYWVRISNTGWYADIAKIGLLKQIADGIK